MPDQQRDHASRLNELTASPPAGVCGAAHPLLKGMWCERLPGHPGRHAAVTGTERSELALEWGEEARGLVSRS